MPKIFISYRREDTPYEAVAVRDRLASHFGERDIFFDLDSIRLGHNFSVRIDEKVGECDYLIAVIGKSWLTVCDKEGERRLDNPDDWVRLEIQAALSRNIPVIAILLHNVRMPDRDELPTGLQELAGRQAHSVRPLGDFRNDIDNLIRDIDQQEQERLEAEKQAVERRQREEAQRVEQERQRAEKERIEAEKQVEDRRKREEAQRLEQERRRAEKERLEAEREPPPAPGPEPPPQPRRGPEPGDEAQGLIVRARDRFDKATKSAAVERQQHLDAALQYAQAACDLDAGWPDPFQLKGRIHQEKGEWLLAAAAYTASLRLNPHAACAHENRGFCKFMAGEYSGARKGFDEAIRLGPTELAYRYRAATNLRLGRAPAAVTDIQNGLTLANQDTPRAALHALCGLLLRDELRLPKESIRCFAEALRLMPLKERSLERQQFLEVSILFDIQERMKVQPAADRPDSGRLNLFTEVQTRFGLKGWSGGIAIPDAGRVNLVAWIQQEFWQACKALYGGCTREAVVEFFDHNPHETAGRLWKEDPEFGLHLATIWAAKQNPGKTIAWLKNLLVVQPLFDIQRARSDPWIGKLQDPDLADFLTPKWSYQEHHAQVLNCLIVTNRSPFRLSALRVRVQVTRRDGEKDEPMALRLASLDAGASQRWPSVFVTGGLFGGNITRVHVTLRCAEGEAKLVGNLSEPDSEKELQKTNPKDDILDVLLVDENPEDQKTNPKDDILDVLLVEEPSEDSPVPKQKPPVRRHSSREF